MIFGKERKRSKLLTTPLTAPQRDLIRSEVPLLSGLPAALQPRLEGAVQVLLDEKRFEGCGGLKLSQDMPLVVCAQAALLQLHAGADFFPGLDAVLVYPEAFVVEHEVHDEAGLVSEEADELAGESWQRGVVILSWEDVGRETADPGAGYNVVLHEFAHQLDEQTGEANGTPLLAEAEMGARWAEACGAAFEQHRRDLGRRREVLFDENAASSPAEFFATAVELFFTVPGDLRREFGAVYSLLAEHFQVDPADW